jgi:regulator of sirC expression with transglutaminase-like and TPR domain
LIPHRLVRASIQAGTNFAATKEELLVLASTLQKTADAAALRSETVGLVGLSGRVLGDDHPLKRKIVASFLKCFDEQLDWSLDDIPDDYLEYRALLLEGGCAAARRRGVR